jgi:threonine/homoserine/homoserine lactone efflux protein
MLQLIASGISIGASAGFIPGPFQAYLLSSTLTNGVRRAFPAVFAPLITDIPVIIVTVFILGQLPDDVLRLIRIIGGLFVLWLAYGALKQWQANKTLDVQEGSSRTLMQAVLVNALSPGPYIFWATINGPLLVSGLEQSVWHGLAFLLAFYGTFLGICAVQVLVWGRARRLDPRVMRALLGIASVLLGVFGVLLMWQGLFPAAS